MKLRWLYTLVALALFLLLTIGIPLWPEFLALPIAGPVNVGMAVYAVLLIGAPVLAFVYLRQRRER